MYLPPCVRIWCRAHPPINARRPLPPSGTRKKAPRRLVPVNRQRHGVLGAFLQQTPKVTMAHEKTPIARLMREKVCPCVGSLIFRIGSANDLQLPFVGNFVSNRNPIFGHLCRLRDENFVEIRLGNLPFSALFSRRWRRNYGEVVSSGQFQSVV